MDSRALLLVEDNPDDQVLTIRALRKNNITTEVVVATDGVEALSYLHGTGASAHEGSGTGPAVVLLDLKLPKVDGLEVLQRIRAHERTRYIPVVVLTTSLETLDIITSYELGANSYIRKPVDFVEFCAAMQHLAHYWLELNEPPPPPQGEGS